MTLIQKDLKSMQQLSKKLNKILDRQDNKYNFFKEMPNGIKHTIVLIMDLFNFKKENKKILIVLQEMKSL